MSDPLPADRPSPSAVSIIIPAYNEQATLPAFIASLKAALPAVMILVVDDGSSDQTAALAVQAGAAVVSHARRSGNGAAVKTGLKNAVSEWVIVADADGQHQVDDLARLFAWPSTVDLVIGARDFRWGRFRDFGNLVLSGLATWLCRMPIADLTSGLRRIHRTKALQFLDLYPQGYSFPTTSTMLFVTSGYAVDFLNIPNRPRPVNASQSKLHPFQDGLRFLSMIYRLILLSYPLRFFATTGVALGLLGILWTLRTLDYSGQVSAAGALMLLTGLILLLFGTIADQLAQIRRTLSRLNR